MKRNLKNHNGSQNTDRPCNKVRRAYINRSIFHQDKLADYPEAHPRSSQNNKSHQKYCQLQFTVLKNITISQFAKQYHQLALGLHRDLNKANLQMMWLDVRC